jgi:peptidoglycan/LPS O-acetylase OafA/YrhL
MQPLKWHRAENRLLESNFQAIETSHAKTTYRSDIDGLRAIAVIAVVGFHAFPTKVTGGFVGVDIFFVISGFLISSIIIKNLERDQFTFLDFYARRVRRIFPALIAVLIACMLAGWFTLFPDEYQQLGKYVGAGAGFVGNFVTLQEAGYFDNSASFKPLLHLWSLGVEEQFYIVWPGLLLVSWRWPKGPIVMASAILVISLFCNLVLTQTNQPAAFYLPVTRFWELMLGCIAAIAESTRPFFVAGRAVFRSYRRHSSAINESAALLGIALIIAAVALINENRSFPGAWALLPTAGSVLLITVGDTTFIGRRLLGHRVLVHIGLISYPLYLWHWPILAFVRILHYEEPSRLVRTTCIVAAFVLAELTYRYVERPVRLGVSTPSKPVITSIVMGLAGSLGLAIFGLGGLPARFPADVQNWIRDYQGEAVASQETNPCFIEPTQSIQKFSQICDGDRPANRRQIVLWGDSHAAHLVPGLKEVQRTGNAFSLAQYTASGCPPIIGFVTRRIPNCGLINEFVARKIEQLKPDTVVMAGRWSLYDGSDGVGRVDIDVIRKTVDKLKLMGVKHIVAIGQFPIWNVAPQKIRARDYRIAATGWSGVATSMRERDKGFLNPSTFTQSEDIDQAFVAAGAIVVSPLSTFCNDEGCMLVVPGGSGEPASWDAGGHLTKGGAIYFVAANAAKIIGASEADRPIKPNGGSPDHEH